MDRADKIVQTLLYGGSILIVAALLWLFPLTIAHKILPRTSPSEAWSLSAESAARVGCALIGLWLLVKKIYIFSSLFITALIDPGFAFTTLPVESKVDLAVSFGELVLAVLLIVRSDLFARAICSARPLGQ
jgi:hypothetical protein